MRVRVATLNVWGLPEPWAEDVPRRMAAIGERLAALHLDIAAFQEVWRAEARRNLIRAGRRAGLASTWYNDAGIGGSGLLVLSRFPMRDVHFEPYLIRGELERLSNGEFLSDKGFARVTLDTGMGAIDLVNTHLHARYQSRVPHAYRSHRVGQIVQLAAQALQRERPTIVLGDFNFYEGDPEYRVLGGLTGLRDAAASIGQRQATVGPDNPYRGRGEAERRIDYVFVRDGLARGLETRSVALAFAEPLDWSGRRGAYSNHAGVLAEFELGWPVSVLAERPQPEAIALAATLLREGRFGAELGQRGERLCSGLGLACAVLAALGARRASLGRRHFLGAALRGAATAGLAHGLGFSVLSEIFGSGEIEAFRDLAQALDQIERASLTSIS